MPRKWRLERLEPSRPPQQLQRPDLTVTIRAERPISSVTVIETRATKPSVTIRGTGAVKKHVIARSAEEVIDDLGPLKSKQRYDQCWTALAQFWKKESAIMLLCTNMMFWPVARPRIGWRAPSLACGSGGWVATSTESFNHFHDGKVVKTGTVLLSTHVTVSALASQWALET